MPAELNMNVLSMPKPVRETRPSGLEVPDSGAPERTKQLVNLLD